MSVRACLLSCLAVLAAGGAHAASPGEAVKWHADLEAARREARKRDQPLFVVFRCEH
jgi:hypothetical protein